MSMPMQHIRDAILVCQPWQCGYGSSCFCLHVPCSRECESPPVQYTRSNGWQQMRHTTYFVLTFCLALGLFIPGFQPCDYGVILQNQIYKYLVYL